MKTIHSSLEPLESRIAPASVFAYTDIDGDKVTIKSTAGDLQTAGVVHLSGGQLQLLDVHDPSFNGASITFKVTKAGGGDGLAAVGRIAGGTNNFGTITIKGDLDEIDCGSNTTGTPAIKALNTRTMGLYGSATEEAGGDLLSEINGALGKLNVAGDFQNVALDTFPGTSATIGSIKIGGSLIGGAGGNSGSIDSTGDIGPVKIGRDLRGGSGSGSGVIIAESGLGPVTIGGSLIGGTPAGSGAIFVSAAAGAIKIGGNVLGGPATLSGSIECSSTLASLQVGGSIIGGAGGHSGELHADGAVGALKIGGDLLGGTGAASAFIDCRDTLGRVMIGGSFIGGSSQLAAEISVSGAIHAITIAGSIIGGTGDGTGAIFAGGAIDTVRIGHDVQGASISTGSSSGSGQIEADRIGSVMIGGSIRAGFDDSSGGNLLGSASITVAHDIGSITVKGDIAGTVGIGGDVTGVVISAIGEAAPTATRDQAIGKIIVGGTVEHTQIFGGNDGGISPQNGNAQIGSVKVGGDWVASDLVAGVQDGGTTGFGDAGDTIIGGGASIAKIASIMIKGTVVGTSAGGDQFGFESHAIGSFQASGTAVPIPASPGSVALSPITADVTLRLI